MSTHRPPRDCPVCRDRLEVTQLGCPSCGTGLTGQFAPCEFCGIDDSDRDLLRVFLRSRGNMKELERHLAVSYPTARARFDDLLGRLGLDQPAPTTGPEGTPPAATEHAGGTTDPADERLTLLRAVADGAVSVYEAREALATARHRIDTVRPPD